MRADRLISLLMLLQARGRLTAQQLAAELEVSERTIYRDIDALSASGVPVYADRGPVGGFALLDGYRVELTGLTDAELRAVFLLSIPSAVADLGLDKALADALRKFSASVTAGRRGAEARVRQRYYIDADSWRPRVTTAPHLAALSQAVTDDERAWITYRLPSGPSIEQCIEPYGLVAKEGAWYVVYAPAGGGEIWQRDRMLALPVADLLAVRATLEKFARRLDFDLRQAWAAWCAAVRDRPPFEMLLRVAPAFAPRLRFYGLPGLVCPDVAPDAEGRVTVRATCDSFETARARVLALGGAVEVAAPEALRRSVMDYAEQIVRRSGS